LGQLQPFVAVFPQECTGQLVCFGANLTPLPPETNRRADRYGGAAENRERVVREIIDGIRARCRPVRL
jgi:hypothetical protein